MKKIFSCLLFVFSIFVFATWQYRLSCLLLAILINRQRIRIKWPKAYALTVSIILIAIFISIPNYFQHGKTQLIYLNNKGERIHTPIHVYLVNAVFPEEELMNAGMKISAVFPPTSLSPVFKNLGNRFIREAQHDFWHGKALTFYAPYNRLSLYGSNPGSFAIAQTMNKKLGTDYDGIYITRPQHYDRNKKYPVVFFAHGYLGSWEMYQGLFCRLNDCIIVSVGTNDLSGIF